MNGTLALKESSIYLDILNTMYLAEGEINVLPDMVEFNGIKVKDKFGTQGIAVSHFITTTFRVTAMIYLPLCNPTIYGNEYFLK